MNYESKYSKTPLIKYMHGIVAPIWGFCEHDRRGISRVTQLLASEEEIWSTELVGVL
jgi:hypothetical protein